MDSVQVDDEEVIISFDTNVPLNGASEVCLEVLYSGRYVIPPVSKATFMKLLQSLPVRLHVD